MKHLATLHFRKQNIPNLMGVKFTDEHIMDFVLCAQLAGGKYNMLFGRDGLWSDVRGLPYMTSAKFSDFFTPQSPLPLSQIS